MNIGIIGTGYVGLITSVCFAHLGHKVIGLDKKTDIIQKLSNAQATLYEEKLQGLLEEGITNKRLHFTSDIKDLSKCDIIFLAVGTPPLPNGNADLSQIYAITNTLLNLVDNSTMIAIRSTISVGTMASLRKLLKQNKRENHLGFCPEFLREGSGVSDFLHPHRVVLASDTAAGCEILQNVYKPLCHTQNVPQIICDTFETAELIKYASNVFLATKITFTNQIAQLAQKANANIYKITEAMGLDTRIGNQFLQAGPGYGGSCFPKDTMALTQIGLKYGVDLSLVEKVHEANVSHKKFISSWILSTLNKQGLHGNTYNKNTDKPCIAVWGLTFKANTDDVRDSAALDIITDFINAGFSVRGYDPKGAENFSHIIKSSHINIVRSALEALQNCCALVVLTEWKEFSKIPISEITAYNDKSPLHVFDTRNILDSHSYKKNNINIHTFGLAPNLEV